MADFLIQATLSNLVVATLLAAIAWGVQRRVRSASLANLLWALVMIKLVTPPLFPLAVFEIPSAGSLSFGHTETPHVITLAMDPSVIELNENFTLSENTEVLASDLPLESAAVEHGARMMTLAFVLWLVISTLLFFISAFRITRFHCLLKANSRVHDDLTKGLSADVARQLGLRRHPCIFVTAANIAPFVWWMAGRSVIVVSKRATQQLDEKDFRSIIAHEMAHIKRRDHWFRWLEWLALIGLWWNPVMWWARAQLRASEEMACDDLVLETAAAERHQYAGSLLNMAELLASPTIDLPVVASAINSGSNLEKRLKMIIAERTWKVPSALRMAIVAMAICVFPLGVVYAQESTGDHRGISFEIYQSADAELREAIKWSEVSIVGTGKRLIKTRGMIRREESEGDDNLALKKLLNEITLRKIP